MKEFQVADVKQVADGLGNLEKWLADQSAEGWEVIAVDDAVIYLSRDKVVPS